MATPPNNTPDPVPNTPPVTDPPAVDERQKELDRVLLENADIRKKQKDAETRANAAAEELANLKKAGHKTSGDWQKVAEAAEAEATTWKAKFEKSNQAFVGTLTSAKVREEALKAGLKADLVDLLDTMDFAEVEATIDENNRFNVKGAELAIKNLKVLKPSLFETKAPPKFNAGGPSTPGAPNTVEGAKEKYLIALKNRMKDPVGYLAAHKEYQAAVFEARKAKK